jgi:hypothetical protein
MLQKRCCQAWMRMQIEAHVQVLLAGAASTGNPAALRRACCL